MRATSCSTYPVPACALPDRVLRELSPANTAGQGGSALSLPAIQWTVTRNQMTNAKDEPRCYVSLASTQIWRVALQTQDSVRKVTNHISAEGRAVNTFANIFWSWHDFFCNYHVSRHKLGQSEACGTRSPVGCSYSPAQGRRQAALRGSLPARDVPWQRPTWLPLRPRRGVLAGTARPFRPWWWAVRHARVPSSRNGCLPAGAGRFPPGSPVRQASFTAGDLFARAPFHQATLFGLWRQAPCGKCPCLSPRRQPRGICRREFVASAFRDAFPEAVPGSRSRKPARAAPKNRRARAWEWLARPDCALEPPRMAREGWGTVGRRKGNRVPAFPPRQTSPGTPVNQYASQRAKPAHQPTSEPANKRTRPQPRQATPCENSPPWSCWSVSACRPSRVGQRASTIRHPK